MWAIWEWKTRKLKSDFNFQNSPDNMSFVFVELRVTVLNYDENSKKIFLPQDGSILFKGGHYSPRILSSLCLISSFRGCFF